MIGAQPPVKAAVHPWARKLAHATQDVLTTVVVGSILGVLCALIVGAIGAIFGGLDSAASSSSRAAATGALLSVVISSAKTGAVNFTLARYLLLSKSKLQGVLIPLTIMSVFGGLFGLMLNDMFGWHRLLRAAEIGAGVTFWMSSMAICQRDDNRGRDYLRIPGGFWR